MRVARQLPARPRLLQGFECAFLKAFVHPRRALVDIKNDDFGGLSGNSTIGDTHSKVRAPKVHYGLYNSTASTLAKVIAIVVSCYGVPAAGHEVIGRIRFSD